MPSSRFAVAAGVLAALLGAAGASAERIDVSTVEGLRAAIASAPPGTVIRVLAGTYLIDRTLDVARDDLTIEGEGDATLFRLAAGANEPVFVLGEPVPFVPAVTRRNLTLRRLRIDGSRELQSSELSDTPGREHLRNSCVTVRQAEDSVLEDLTLASCRSGGMVAELTSRRLRLTRVESFDHEFDGLAWDGVITDSIIEDSIFHSNLFAGISFDIGPADNEILRVEIRGNGRSGVFLRDADRNRFVDCTITRNGEDGVFLADGDAAGADAVDNLFLRCDFTDHPRFGFWQAGARSTGNRVESGLFRCNRAGAIEESFPTAAPLLLTEVTVAACTCIPTDTVLCLNGGRFRAEIQWGDFQGGSGQGRTVPFGSDDSGLFYFFNPRNWEMLIKVLDACSFDGHFWVFYSATTNVEFELTVTDTATGAEQVYRNPLGMAAPPVQDTGAFATCP